MDMERSPDCVCGDTGRVRAEDVSSPACYRPCGRCLRRYEETHCTECDARLDLSGRDVWELDRAGGSGLAPLYACGRSCAQSWLVSQHGPSIRARGSAGR